MLFAQIIFQQKVKTWAGIHDSEFCDIVPQDFIQYEKPKGRDFPPFPLGNSLSSGSSDFQETYPNHQPYFSFCHFSSAHT